MCCCCRLIYLYNFCAFPQQSLDCWPDDFLSKFKCQFPFCLVFQFFRVIEFCLQLFSEILVEAPVSHCICACDWHLCNPVCALIHKCKFLQMIGLLQFQWRNTGCLQIIFVVPAPCLPIIFHPLNELDWILVHFAPCLLPI